MFQSVERIARCGWIRLSLLLAIVIGLVFPAPISLVVFVYGLAMGRSFSEGASAAAEIAVNIVGEVASRS